ncbi:MAG TPA: CDP-alcohol phosphatidyltransferase family protein [Gemmatimonadaceae bacterium]|nr:CDP-alcohol phosphatidyltransferase family protein [Gemmatimonadaceae bacterium]
MNLPNALTVGRIAITPLVAVLPFVNGSTVRAIAFVLFIVAAVTDYVDGYLARRENLITDLGKWLDPLADKLLLLGTFVPMYYLMRGAPMLQHAGQTIPPDGRFPTLLASMWLSLPLWVVIVVLGREAFMTAFREVAKRRGVVISSIGPAKWKTTFQSIWIGAAYCWFFAATLAREQGWGGNWWSAFAYFNGAVVALSMIGAVALTIWSLALYVQRYGSVIAAPTRSHAG